MIRVLCSKTISVLHPTGLLLSLLFRLKKQMMVSLGAMSNLLSLPSMDKNVSSVEIGDMIDLDALPETQFAKIVKRGDIMLMYADHLQRLLSATVSPFLLCLLLLDSQGVYLIHLCVRKSKGEPMWMLIDTRSSENFIHPDKVKKLRLSIMPGSERILMARSSHLSPTLGYCVASFNLSGRKYRNVKLSVIASLCCDIILEHNFQGPLPPLTVCGLTAIKNILYSSLFTNLTSGCHPIAVKSKGHSILDIKIHSVRNLLYAEGRY